MDSSKLDSIKKWKEPRNVKDLQSFLGLCNYYRDFIRNYAEIAGPLYKLTRKDLIFNWNPDSQNAFDLLKSAFQTNCILIQPDCNKQFYLECDASDYALGAVLSQKDESGVLRPVGFYSRKFSSAEINYEIYDKELLAIIEGFKNWRHYCIGTHQPVIVFTDHNNLRYFMTSRHLNRRQARWSLFLADYNFELIVRPGSEQVVSDALSRQESLQIKPGDDEYLVNQQILLSRDKFHDSCRNEKKDYLYEEASNHPRKEAPRGQTGTHLNAIDTDEAPEPCSSDESQSTSANSDYDITTYVSDAPEESDFDEDDVSAVGDVSQFMELEGHTESEDPHWFQDLLQYLWNGGLPLVLAPRIIRKIKLLARVFLFKNDRLYRKVLKNGQMYHVPYVPFVEREEVIRKYHWTLGHMQANTLLPLLEVRYYWPSLEADIKKFQSQCPQCQLNRGPNQFLRRPLQPHQPVGIPFMKWGIDWVQGLPPVDEHGVLVSKNGYCNIFSARCYATKRVIYVATKNRDAKTTAECIFKHIVCKYGPPVELVSDRGTCFMDTVFQEYLKLLEIHHLPSAAYTPRTNGLDERGHRDLKSIITKLSNGDPRKWLQLLPLAEFIMNSRISNSTGFSAFYLTHGFEPRLPGDELPALPPSAYDLSDEVEAANYTASELAKLGFNRAAALQKLKVQAARMKLYYDRKVGVSNHRWEEGDVVKLRNHSRSRFKFPWLGPFYVVHQGPNNTYYLQKPDGRRWTSQNGTDTPINPEDLALFSEFDGF
jgi:hypothetical protein